MERSFIYLHSLVLAFYSFEIGLVYSAIYLQLSKLYVISSVNIWERTEQQIKHNF